MQQQREQQAQQFYSRIDEVGVKLSRFAGSPWMSASQGGTPQQDFQTVEDLVTIREQSRHTSDRVDSVLRRLQQQPTSPSLSPQSSLGSPIPPTAITDLAEAVASTVYLQHDIVRWVQQYIQQQEQQKS
jgi:hypothetical protein